MDLRQAVVVLRHQALYNKWFQGACVAALVFAVYIITSGDSTPFNHYVRLADAFLDGRLYLLDAPEWLELARYGDKAYVIWPPAPTLFVLPWVAIWGVSTNQTVITVLVGSAAMGLFWVAASQLRWSLSFRVSMTLLLALGTSFWWAATDGSVWTLAQVSAVFFLMAALVETTGRNRPWVIGILVGLAGLSRLPTFLIFPFFAYTITSGVRDRRSLIRLGIFGLTLAAMGGVYLAYTYAQHGAFTLGYDRGDFAAEPWFSKGLFDISYIPRHLNAILFNVPRFTDEFPFFKPSYIGLGLFFTTPALLYIFRVRLNGMSMAALVSVAAIAIPIVTYGATGWSQFGYRFSLDALPLIAILVASGMGHRLNRLMIAVILLSCAVNLWGTLAFHKFDWVV